MKLNEQQNCQEACLSPGNYFSPENKGKKEKEFGYSSDACVVSSPP
jgi:hypothetical protein